MSNRQSPGYRPYVLLPRTPNNPACKGQIGSDTRTSDLMLWWRPLAPRQVYLSTWCWVFHKLLNRSDMYVYMCAVIICAVQDFKRYLFVSHCTLICSQSKRCGRDAENWWSLFSCHSLLDSQDGGCSWGMAVCGGWAHMSEVLLRLPLSVPSAFDVEGYFIISSEAQVTSGRKVRLQEHEAAQCAHKMWTIYVSLTGGDCAVSSW